MMWIWHLNILKSLIEFGIRNKYYVPSIKYQQAKSLMQQRDTYFDFLRGIAIIMVIGIHTYVDGLMHFNLFLRQFLNCAVPIFLAISGYFIGHKSFAEQGSYGKFLKKQVPRVYIPMLLWSIPWMLLAIRGGEPPLVSIFRTFVGDMSIFYFIILIIQYYALTPLIQRVNRKSGGAIMR